MNQPPYEGVPPDAHVKIVSGFWNPTDAYLSMGKIPKGEMLTWSIFLNRHARRKTRNAHRQEFARHLALTSRSEDAWGSMEAAQVAAMRVAGPASLLERMLGNTNGGPPSGGQGAFPPPQGAPANTWGMKR